MSGIMSLFYLRQHTDAFRPPNRVPEHHFPKYSVKLTNSKEAENYSLGRLFRFVCFHQLNMIYYTIFTPKSLSLSVLVAQKKTSVTWVRVMWTTVGSLWTESQCLLRSEETEKWSDMNFTSSHISVACKTSTCLHAGYFIRPVVFIWMNWD